LQVRYNLFGDTEVTQHKVHAGPTQLFPNKGKESRRS
jgi:hypothetical protein